MRLYTISICIILLTTIISCKGKAKKQMVEQRLIELQIEQDAKDSLGKQESKSLASDTIKTASSQEENGDKIIGIWEVNNSYYTAIYEIIKYDDQFYGKVHYYNDGTTEHKGTDSKEDYFLEGIFFKNNKYTEGKMHMPDGTIKTINLLFENDEIKVDMEIDGTSFQEAWKRKEL